MAGSAHGEWFRALIDEGVASGGIEPRIDPHRFVGLMGATTLFPCAGNGGLDFAARQSHAAAHGQNV